MRIAILFACVIDYSCSHTYTHTHTLSQALAVAFDFRYDFSLFVLFGRPPEASVSIIDTLTGAGLLLLAIPVVLSYADFENDRNNDDDGESIFDCPNPQSGTPPRGVRLV